jgi:plastocyanin
MTRFRGRLAALAAATAAGGVLALILPGLAVAGTTTVQVGQQNGGTAAAFQFNAASIVVRTGDTVHWTLFNGIHTVTAYDEASPGVPQWDSGTLASTFDHTFTTPGVYTYYCQFHSGRAGASPANIDTSLTSGLMVGKITVVDPARVGGVAELPSQAGGPQALATSSGGGTPWWVFAAAAAAGTLLVAAAGAAVRRRLWTQR